MIPWIAALALAAQASTFEVASVKPVIPLAGPHTVSLLINRGRLDMVAAELRQIVGLAYAIQRVRVVGGPVWMDADQFDITAKADNPDATRDEIRTMLQALLADRFQLVVHRETKILPEYSLVLAKSGSKLKEAAADKTASLAHTTGPTGGSRSVFEGSALRVLVNMLANTFGSPVLDKTGLEGKYDFTFDWPDSISGIFSALEDQLGLKLEAKKTPTEVLVIDRAQKPSAN
jgi:uncharacterized protein (TIGR03435 family)